jgi:hypothetical protein
MPGSRRLAAVLLASLLVALGPRAAATIVVSLDLAQLVQGADTVAYGRVVDVFTVRVDGRYSETLVTLAPSALLKGQANGDIVFRVPGGEMGRYRTVVVGAPVLHVNDEVVVFLAGQPPRVPHVVGFSQGVLPIVRDEARRPIVLAPPVADRSGGQRVVRGGAPTRVMLLSAFADDVRAMVEGRPRRERLPTAASRRPGAGGPGHP